MDEFDTWFVKAHRALPDNKYTDNINMEIHNLRYKIYKLESELKSKESIYKRCNTLKELYENCKRAYRLAKRGNETNSSSQSESRTGS